MADLNETGGVVRLPRDVRLRTPGLRGTATLLPPLLRGDQRATEVGRTSPHLADALERTGFRSFRAVEVQVTRVGRAPTEVRSADGRRGIVVDVPAAGPDQGQVLLLTDEGGVRSWHFPRPAGTPQDVRFVVPAETTVPRAAPGGHRGAIGTLGKKLLSVLVYPIVERAVGVTAEFLARRYEERIRPYLLRNFHPDDYTTPGAGQITGADWERLRGGRVLLFVHGTFSTSHSGFAALPAERLRQLGARYDGVLAFDHPTLGVGPNANVEELLGRLPDDLDIDVDVIAHSRGGLVARALAERTQAGGGQLRVGRVVFVATPNAGTLLADPEHIGSLLDRYTTLLDLIPDGPWSAVTDVLSGVLSAVQVIGQGALGGLPGIVAMRPENPWLSRLGDGCGADVGHYAIDADYEPSGGLLRLVRLADAVVDHVFGTEANDMVVPTAGVATAPGRVGFPIATEHRRHFAATESAWHCSLFSRPETGEALGAWCVGNRAG